MTLPIPQLYNASIEVIPWKITLEAVAEAVSSNAKYGSAIMDLMCGPGQLLAKISRTRPDLRLSGLDIDTRYTSFGKKNVREVEFVTEDIMRFTSTQLSHEQKFDVLIITSGLHHLEYDLQLDLLQSLHNILKPDGFVIVGEICIRNGREKGPEFYSEVMNYHWAVIRHALGKTTEKILIEEAVDVFRADLIGEEFKHSRKDLEIILNSCFQEVTTVRTWPKTCVNSVNETGEYMFTCSM